MGLLYTLCQSLIVLIVILEDESTRFIGSWCCGEVAVVERLKKKCMACPPGPNQLAVVERWPIVEVSLYAMHIIKCKILNDFLFFPPLPRYICANSISSAFCFARVLDHPVRSTTELHFSISSVLIRSVLI